MIEGREEIKLKIGDVLYNAPGSDEFTFAEIFDLLTELASEFKTGALNLPVSVRKQGK